MSNDATPPQFLDPEDVQRQFRYITQALRELTAVVETIHREHPGNRSMLHRLDGVRVTLDDVAIVGRWYPDQT